MAVALLLTSCGYMSLPWKSRGPDTLLDTFNSGEPAERFVEVLSPNASRGHGTNAGVRYRPGRWDKNFEFSGVRQDERVLADALRRVADDMLARVKASGAAVQGGVRLPASLISE